MTLSLKRLTWIIEKVNKSYELDDEQKQVARLAILAYLDASAATLKGHEANARRVEACRKLLNCHDQDGRRVIAKVGLANIQCSDLAIHLLKVFTLLVTFLVTERAFGFPLDGE